jgi:hypothetical protein
MEFTRCFETLTRGLSMVTVHCIFKKAFLKALAVTTRLSTSTFLCHQFFEFQKENKCDFAKLPMTKFEMIVAELEALRRASEDTTSQQVNLIDMMEMSEIGSAPTIKTWIALERIKLDFSKNEKTEESMSRNIADLYSIIAELKKVQHPSFEETFSLAIAYFLTHVVTTTKLAER